VNLFGGSFCKFWFDKNLEKWFSVSVKMSFFPAKKSYTKKKKN
jgi:hypothetical protein